MPGCWLLREAHRPADQPALRLRPELRFRPRTLQIPPTERITRSGAQHGGEARARLSDPLSLAPAVRVCDGVTACPPCAELPTSAAVFKAGNVYVPRFETAGRPHLPEGVVPSLRQPRRPSALFPATSALACAHCGPPACERARPAAGSRDGDARPAGRRRAGHARALLRGPRKREPGPGC